MLLLPVVRVDFWLVPCRMLWSSNVNSRRNSFLQEMLKKRLEQVPEHRGPVMCCLPGLWLTYNPQRGKLQMRIKRSRQWCFRNHCSVWKWHTICQNCYVWISGYLLLSSSSKFLYGFTVNFPVNVFVWCFWAVSTNNYKVIVLSESLTWGPCCISLLSWMTLVDRSVILRHKVRSLGLQFFFFPSTHATS